MTIRAKTWTSPSLQAKHASTIRRLLKLSFGRWIAQGNDSSEGCLYLPAELHIHDSKFLLEGSLTDRARVPCLITSFAWIQRAMPR
jgi:hypothetical protein